VLPDVVFRFHEVDVDATVIVEKDGQARLVVGGSMSLQDAARAKRESIPARVDAAAQIVADSPDDHFILWHDLEAERHALADAIPAATAIWGSLDLDTREERIRAFSDGGARILATKPVLSGSGCNFQRHCHRAVFVGIDFKFNDFIQAVHRIHRFLQTEQVVIDIIHTTAERDVRDVLLAKKTQHEELTDNMSQIIREFGLDSAAIENELARTMGVERIEASGEGWTVAHNDCVYETQSMDENSVDMVLTSIPFSNHYEYTPAYEDFGHTDDNAHFWAQMDFLTPELLRVLRPGRIAAVHVKDRILFGNVTGAGVPTVSPFHVEAIQHFIKHGFDYLGMRTIVTDVVRENNQTYRLGYTEMRKDATKMGSGSPSTCCCSTSRSRTGRRGTPTSR
jgi:SAM-dependent methyltransferase